MAHAAAGPSLGERLRTVRDRLLASRDFQRWAIAFPLTRLIARRRARTLFDLVAGFVYSQVLFACVRLRLLELLQAGPLRAPEIAQRLALPHASTLRLLEAAVALRLLQARAGGRYGLGDLGAAMLGNPGISAMVEHHRLLYADLENPVALLRKERGDGALARYWAYARAEEPAALGADQVAGYTQLMSASQQLVADEILDAYPMRRHRCLLDVGGGDGTFLCAAARRAPQLKLMLFDLPAVAQKARARFAAEGLADRATAVGGSFHSAVLPAGADVISLVRVIHDHDDARAAALLSAARRALAPGGTLILAEPMAGTRGAEAMGAAYFGWYLMAMGSGRPRTPQELEALLRAAGFDRVRLLRTRVPLQTLLMTAH
jgi:demethylspheroidene O-methyltransferase